MSESGYGNSYSMKAAKTSGICNKSQREPKNVTLFFDHRRLINKSDTIVDKFNLGETNF